MLLETINVEKRFGGLAAVNDVSIQVEQGEIYGIIGPNGAGKTTFINCISGYYKPDKGRVFFDGKEVTGFSPFDLCHRGIARTFQIVRSFPKMTALENVKVAVVYGGKHHRGADKRARELMEFVQFPTAEDTLAENLNILQLKRLELARALSCDCKLLLLDEVAAGLNPSELPDFIDLIKRIRDTGVTIVCIEHVMKFIMACCSRIAVLNFGKKIAEGVPSEINQNQEVIEAYLGESIIH